MHEKLTVSTGLEERIVPCVLGGLVLILAYWIFTWEDGQEAWYFLLICTVIGVLCIFSGIFAGQKIEVDGENLTVNGGLKGRRQYTFSEMTEIRRDVGRLAFFFNDRRLAFFRDDHKLFSVAGTVNGPAKLYLAARARGVRAFEMKEDEILKPFKHYYRNTAFSLAAAVILMAVILADSLSGHASFFGMLIVIAIRCAYNLVYRPRQKIWVGGGFLHYRESFSKEKRVAFDDISKILVSRDSMSVYHENGRLVVDDIYEGYYWLMEKLYAHNPSLFTIFNNL